MPSWLEQSWKRGILTTRYPRIAAQPGEIPDTALPPIPNGPAVALATSTSSCPTGAITRNAVDQGKCIRCARCRAQGFAFAGPLESSVARRPDLVWLEGTPHPTEEAGSLVALGRSVHVFLVDVGSCNACNLEVLALANPYYDSQRLGIFFTNSPRHADVLLVVGVPTAEMVEPMQRAYAALPSPKAVVAVGVCPTSGGIFAGNPGLRSSLDELVPVDRYVPGCPPHPLAVLDAILTLMGRHRPSAGGR
ncbi:MAG: NADH:ubiquinone oxidoreductase [Thermoplasmata archaeon]